MCSYTKFIYFTLEWKIRWSEFDSIKIVEQLPRGIRKDFITAYNNIPLRWHVQLRQHMDDESKLAFYIYYDEVPMEMIDGVESEIGIVKADGTMRVVKMLKPAVIKRAYCRACWLFDNDSDLFRAKYGLADADRLVFQITVKIPVERFSYVMPIPSPKPSAPWAVDLFKAINDANNSSFSDVKLISRGGVVFYCHKNVIAVQSEPLAKMRSNTNGERDFSHMSTASLKSMVEYLYTGKPSVVNLSVYDLIEVADAADQFALESLKKWCGGELWKRVVDVPRLALQIVRFADRHADMKWLKHRAFDVIVENLEDAAPNPAWDPASDLFGGTCRKELRDEFIVYSTRRLRPYVKP